MLEGQNIMHFSKLPDGKLIAHQITKTEIFIEPDDWNDSNNWRSRADLGMIFALFL